jgi:hypothetical protein
MLSRSSDSDSFGTNVLTAAVIAGSALLLYAFVATPIGKPEAQVARAPAVIQQVVVKAPAPSHVS